MTVNLIVQWASIGVIFLIILIIAIRKIISMVRGKKTPGCSCSCGSSCQSCPSCTDGNNTKRK